MEIHYVHGVNVDTNDPILRKILEFCSSRDIAVKLRHYDTIEFEEDRDIIVRLPAIHIYKRNGYSDTIYPDFKPVQILALEYEKFQLEELEKESKRQIWEARLKHLKSIFRSLKTDSVLSKSDRK